jgi:hypothetical protein
LAYRRNRRNLDFKAIADVESRIEYEFFAEETHTKEDHGEFSLWSLSRIVFKYLEYWIYLLDTANEPVHESPTLIDLLGGFGYDL